MEQTTSHSGPLRFLQEVGRDSNKDRFGGGQQLPRGIRKLSFGVVTAAGGAGVAAGQGERDAEGNGPKVVDFEVAGHGEDAAGAVGFAHGLIEKGSDDTAMGVARRSGEARCKTQVGDDVVVGIGKEFETEAGAVFESTAETVVEGAMSKGNLHRTDYSEQ
jgi:hypothetical protein